jgi:S2P endopeptidase
MMMIGGLTTIKTNCETMIFPAITITLFWTSLTLIVRILRNYYEVDLFLERRGLNLDSFGQIRWSTERLNHSLQQLGRRFKHSAHTWYTIGVYTGGVLLVASLVIMTVNVSQSLLASSGSVWFTDLREAPVLLTPVIPGVNVPTSQLVFYFFAILAGGIFHEFAHAVAASALDCRLNSVGLFAMFVYPGAFVDVNEEDLLSLPPWEQLQVFCAGAWHNAVLALLALALLSSHRLFLGPFFASNANIGGGVTVVVRSSELQQLFQVHDKLLRIDDCAVNNVIDWKQCLLERIGHNSTTKSGYCLSVLEVNQVLRSSIADSDCCSPNSQSAFQCFLVHEERICLPSTAYTSLHNLAHRCDGDTDCILTSHSEKRFCMKPQLEDDSVCLFRLEVFAMTAPRRVMMYRGLPDTLWMHLLISDVSIRSIWIAQLFDTFSLNVDMIPHIWFQLWFYTASLNAAMALLNMAPVYRMDGEWALRAFVRILVGHRRFRDYFAGRDGDLVVEGIVSKVLFLGATLIALTIFFALKSLV